MRHLIDKELGERWSLRVVGISPGGLRDRTATDRPATTKAKIITLAQNHRRYRAGMTDLKLHQFGEIVDHKRADLIYASWRWVRCEKTRQSRVFLYCSL